ncbi:MAG: CsbD family protein [Myxococcaceae bacterium]|nr:CsbD family protein [Myxococcaceae bacterium]
MGELSDKIKGRLKSVMGKASGDRRLEAEGEAEEMKGKVKGGVEEAKQEVKGAIRREPGPEKR